MPRHCTTCLERFPDDIGRCPADSTPLIDVSAWMRPIVGSFRLGERIGGGDYADVYRAHDVNGCLPPAAVKVFRESNNEARRRLRTELAAAQRIRSSHVPRFLAGNAAGEGEPLFLATELQPGTSVRVLYEQEGALDARRLLAIAAGVAEALQAAEAEGICHRGLRPGHILLSGTGDACTASLIDFGAARIDGIAAPVGALTVAAPEYMAPEALRGQAVPASDRYSLGVVLYELGTGRNPFQDESTQGTCWRHENYDPEAPRPETGAPPWPRALAPLVLSLLAKEPANRPGNAAIMLACREMVEELRTMERIRVRRIDSRFPVHAALPLAAAGAAVAVHPESAVPPAGPASQEPGTSRPPKWVRRGDRSLTSGATRGVK